MSVTWATAVLNTLHDDLADLIDAGGSAGYVKIVTATSAELSVLPLDYPCAGAATGGVLTVDIGARDEAATASGTAANALVYTATGTLIGTFTCQQGTSPVANVCVLTTLSIVGGAPVEISSFTVG